MIEIEIQQGDITKAAADAIVAPANNLGWMGGGSAGAIKKEGGDEIEQEAMQQAPLELGKAIATKAGKLPHQAVIHAPTLDDPSGQAQEYNVSMSVKGALTFADDLKYTSLAMPGMGTGVGGFPKDKAAKVMIDEIKKFEPLHLQKIILVDIDQEMVDQWNENK
jgi:O-acetyl-ADP-ribose deacetylase (regulator of RNase III)